jgi:hypothetical protein
VISAETKRTISFGVFGFGIFGGLCGCLIWAKAAFTFGGNDTLPEILAITFAFATPLPACVFALWKRVAAGSWLIFAGCFLFYGFLDERAWMIYGGVHQDTVLRTIMTALPLSGVLIGIGLFGILTGLAKWPKLLGRA